MSVLFVVPLVAAMAVGVLVSAAHRRLPPILAARMVTVTLVVVASAAIPTFWIVAMAYFAHLPILGRGFRWCVEIFGIHEPVSGWLGLPAAFVSGIGIVRAISVFCSFRRHRTTAQQHVAIVSHDEPFAYTLPGRGGQVVLSSGLIEVLDQSEQKVVLAHEHAHARHRHDRYLLAAELSAALVPMLRALSSRLRFSLERWADESAVDECGDRRFVARTIGKVALIGAAPAFALSFGGLGVPARVGALLTEPVSPPSRKAQVVLWSAIAATAVLASFQIHHVVEIITQLCPG